MNKTLYTIIGLFIAVTILFCTQQPALEYAIAYNVLVDAEKDDYDVFVKHLDGTSASNITNHQDVAWTYLCVNDKVLFISDRDTSHRNYFLYEMETDGSNIRKISDVRLRDSWMGSRYGGSEIIVNVHGSVDTAFYIIDRKGTLLDKINPGLAYFNDPVFSPDGKQIVFRGASKPFKKDTGYIDELYIMNADGSELRQLTQYPADDTTAAWYAYHAGPPRWHPTKTSSATRVFRTTNTVFTR